jgi:catechol 2,3-dioxygenase-like lactoylglutathione lyase family enzyme
MLSKGALIAFLATAQPARARAFYEGTLGFRLVTDDQFALLFDCNGTSLRIQKVDSVDPVPYTALGWHVSDIRETVEGLSKRGVIFEQYVFLEQDELGVWTAPSGTSVAWFKDPDGNLLSVAQSEADAR